MYLQVKKNHNDKNSKKEKKSNKMEMSKQWKIGNFSTF